MRDVWQDFLLGIAPAHRVALLCLAGAPLLLIQTGRVAPRFAARWRAAPDDVRWSAALLGVLAVTHLALPWRFGSVPAAVVFGWLAVRAVGGRSWRGRCGVLVPSLLLLHAFFAGVRAVDADQVAMAVAVLELAVLSIAARRLVARAATVALVVVFGITMWLVSFTGHDHGGVDRLQAGTIQRPAGPPPTAVDRAAARDLAERVRAATAAYTDRAAALADGYTVSGPAEGLQVHYEHKVHQRDGRVMDPAAPEQLVYAVRDGRSLLLGVAFQVPVAGERGPAIGGARWHAHDVCIGLLPPGFGVVSPYGSCPGLTFATTFPEMIHVWVVDPPGGPYADHLDDTWVTARLFR